MKHLAIGLGIALAIGISLSGIAYGLAIALGQKGKDLLPMIPFLIPSPLVLATTIAQALERDEGRKSVAAGHRAPAYDFSSFQIAWPLMFVYGAAVLTGALSFGSFFGAFLAGKGGALTGSLLFVLFTAYHVGGWIGTRCSRYGIATLLLATLCTAILGVVLDWVSLSDEEYRDARGFERSSLLSLLPIIFNTPIIFAIGLVGYWRGRKRRLSEYFSYLLSVLPPETRETVVGLAVDEAQRAASAKPG